MSDTELKQINSNKVLQKFMWHKQRFDNSARGVLKAKQLFKKIEEAEKQGKTNGPSFWLQVRVNCDLSRGKHMRIAFARACCRR